MFFQISSDVGLSQKSYVPKIPFFYEGDQLFNALPNNIRNVVFINEFKSWITAPTEFKFSSEFGFSARTFSRFLSKNSPRSVRLMNRLMTGLFWSMLTIHNSGFDVFCLNVKYISTIGECQMLAFSPKVDVWDMSENGKFMWFSI